MLIDICHFRHQVWRLIIAICVLLTGGRSPIPILQSLKSSAYLDSVGISGVCLGSSRVSSKKWEYKGVKKRSLMNTSGSASWKRLREDC